MSASGSGDAWQAITNDDMASLQRCADVISPYEYGRTPLHLAAERGRVAMVEWLVLDRNAPLDTRDNGGDTPIHRAALWGKVNCVRALLRMHAKVDVCNNWEHTALWYSINCNLVRCSAALLLGNFSLEKLSSDITTPEWSIGVRDAIVGRRRNCRSTCVALLGVCNKRSSALLPPHFGRDVMRLICKDVWATRNTRHWGILPPLPDLQGEKEEEGEFEPL
jgi:hypothetical protein